MTICHCIIDVNSVSPYGSWDSLQSPINARPCENTCAYCTCATVDFDAAIINKF